MGADVISRYVKHPKRQPEYREERSHFDFLRTIDVHPEDIKEAIADAWKAGSQLINWPRRRMAKAMAEVAARSMPLQAEPIHENFWKG